MYFALSVKRKKMRIKILSKLTIFISLILILLLLFGCGSIGSSGGNNGNSTISITWDANHETRVNNSGGGYRVYHSRSPGFSLDDPDAFMKEVPFVSGSQAPTTTTLTLENGTWYIKIVAFMDLNGESVSLPSEQKSITLP